jgi:hypothetical protein
MGHSDSNKGFSDDSVKIDNLIWWEKEDKITETNLQGNSPRYLASTPPHSLLWCFLTSCGNSKADQSSPVSLGLILLYPAHGEISSSLCSPRPCSTRCVQVQHWYKSIDHLIVIIICNLLPSSTLPNQCWENHVPWAKDGSIGLSELRSRLLFDCFGLTNTSYLSQ